MKITTMAEAAANEHTPEVLFWVGCAGSFDQRSQKITKAFAKILNKAGVDFAVLGEEENCTGDPARRAGNEFLFQMMAQQNIETLNGYGVKTIVTTCPHCFNTLQNEYPELGGHYDVLHHTQFLQQLIDNGRLQLQGGGAYKGKRITFHDSCYLGRSNGVYEAPRELIRKLDAELVEMRSCRSKGLCCGAGGGQMFKEAEQGKKEVNVARMEEAIETRSEVVAAACPFCMTMMDDGIKQTDQEGKMQAWDVAELIAKAEDL
jgi:Fe-S oxidoreductase